MKLGFIGCGQMAQCLAKGFVKASLFLPENILLSDTNQPLLDAMQLLGYESRSNNVQVVKEADVIIIAVKPKDAMAALHKDVLPHWNDSKLLVSICAGITLDTLNMMTNYPMRIVRVMPNVCCLVGESATGFTCSVDAQKEDRDLIKQMFSAVGRCYEVQEGLMDAVTGVSGSGPAYIFMLIEAMADAGVKGGLSREISRGLAAQTVLGSAKMVLDSPSIHPGQLRDSVTSPGGTTIVGVAELERHGFRHAIISAIDASRLKSEEMSNKE